MTADEYREGLQNLTSLMEATHSKTAKHAVAFFGSATLFFTGGFLWSAATLLL